MIATFDNDINTPSFDENLVKEVDKNIEKFKPMTMAERLEHAKKLNKKIIAHDEQQYIREEKLDAINKSPKERSDSKINGTMYTLGHLVACGLIGAGVAEGLYGWDTNTIKCLETTLGATLPMGLTLTMLDYFAYCGKPLTNKFNDIKANILKKKIAKSEKQLNSELLSKVVLDRMMFDDTMER